MNYFVNYLFYFKYKFSQIEFCKIMLCSVMLSPGIDINVSKEFKGNKHTNIKPPPMLLDLILVRCFDVG